MHFKKRSKKKKKRTPEWSKITTKFWFHILEKKKMPPSKGSLLGGSIGWWSRDNLSRDQIDHVNDGRGWEAQGQRGQRVQVSIMTFSAYRQARAWVLFQQLIMTLFLEGMSAQPALFLHWEPNWARSSITILNSTCLIFGSENP